MRNNIGINLIQYVPQCQRTIWDELELFRISVSVRGTTALQELYNMMCVKSLAQSAFMLSTNIFSLIFRSIPSSISLYWSHCSQGSWDRRWCFTWALANCGTQWPALPEINIYCTPSLSATEVSQSHLTCTELQKAADWSRKIWSFWLIQKNSKIHKIT